MNLSDRISRRCGKSDIPQIMRDWIASSPSRHSASDGTQFWLPHVSNAKDCIAAILLSNYIPYWETAELYERIGRLAYQARYTGKWEVVQELLEHNDPSQAPSEDLWLQVFSADEFFGNILPECGKFLQRNRKTYRSYDRLRRPRPKSRPRGYQDKGSQRPLHQRGRNLPDPNPGIDRRARVIHPLLKSLEEGTDGSTLPTVGARKEEIQNDQP